MPISRNESGPMATYENQSLTRSFGLLEILARARNSMSLAQLSKI